MSTLKPDHKPVVVINGEGVSYCRLCGVRVFSRVARNGRAVTAHVPNATQQFPVLDDALKPVPQGEAS